MATSTVELTPTPLLSEKHNGIPERLKAEAQAAKERVWSNKTAPDTVPRRDEAPKLPPGVSREAFNDAIAELKTLMGEQHVELNDRELVDGWYMEHPNTHDSNHLIGQDDLVCSAVVYPGNVEDVQACMRWANKHGIPVHPISMGRNLGYGGAAPRLPGAVVLDLGRRMNRVLKIDGSNASCIVEPGVSYFALYEAVQKTGLPLWIDCPDVGGGSVLGNAVDRGVGYTPYGDHFGMHCGMEIVLPNGELLRTGMGALPGKDGADNPTWQSFQNAYGPQVHGLFSQSNYGVVVKMGMWLMPATDHQSYMITFPRDEDFEQIVDIIRPLAMNKVLGNVPQLRHVIQELAVLGLPRSHWYKGKGQMPRDVIRQGALGLPIGDVSWVFYGTQYGDRASISGQLEVIKSEFAKVSGSKFYLPSDLPEDHYLRVRENVCCGIPMLREIAWMNWVPNGGHLAFSPIAPCKGKDARIIHEIITSVHKKHGIDVFSTLCIAGREIHYISEIIFDRSDPEMKSAARAIMKEAIAACAKEGYGEYRTHLLFQDQVSGTYNWNDNALMKFNELLKDAIDPNGILAPGRNGIWPKKYRDQGWKSDDAVISSK